MSGTLVEAIGEIVDALAPVQAEIPGLQVYGFWNDNPSPPSIDVYPATPFQEGAGFGVGEKQVFMTVRARVAMADSPSAQQWLYRMLDPGDAASVEAALATVDWVVPADADVAGFTFYADDLPASERMIGCEWRMARFL